MQQKRWWVENRLLLLLVLGALLLVWWMPTKTPSTPVATGDGSTSKTTSYNGLINGTADHVGTWMLNLTLDASVHQVTASVGWHGNGPKIHAELVFPNGTRVPGKVNGNYPFTVVTSHTPGGGPVKIVLTSYTPEEFDVKIETIRLAAA